MRLHFDLQIPEQASESITVDIDQFVIAGWAGRDLAAIEHHIEELAALGVPRPSAVPLYYRVAANQLVQEERIQVVGGDSSGEAEVLVFMHRGELLVSLTSDHTDRRLESHSVALSKQACPKPVATTAWRHADVAAHWDRLELYAEIEKDGQTRVYQHGPLAGLRTPADLIAGHWDGGVLPAGTAMSCGSVAAQGGIRPAAAFAMELRDPVRRRVLRHRYATDVLPHVA
ncbi:DUF2848 domain-containing protein [Xylophilus sp.]|uniref:DUF2848 domain-containing protein n=1 Tax=Xylophilus sp. TaxID=2653893 RepID=UPI0013B7F6BC|nr:DUF2848 domain-containing protein [Xylophilus sp.]KAF1050236.1 MAG: hypothetical protein GAK38_00262 [Xylophilus sp.]